MDKKSFAKLKVGDKAIVTGTHDGETFSERTGVVHSRSTNTVDVCFDDWREGWGPEQSFWCFDISVVRMLSHVTPAPKPKKASPKGAQAYKGNGKHEWQLVTVGTRRLRVPGGWLYQLNGATAHAMTFVPVPEAVGYAV